MRLLTLLSLGVFGAAAFDSALCATDRLVAHPAPPAQADEAMPEDRMTEPLAAGRIVALDVKNSRVVIDHRGIDRLYLEPSTSAFRVQHPALLYGHSAGDKIRFDVEREGKSLIVTRIENSL